MNSVLFADCGKNEFTCRSNGACISHSLVCNKMADCADLRRAEFALNRQNILSRKNSFLMIYLLHQKVGLQETLLIKEFYFDLFVLRAWNLSLVWPAAMRLAVPVTEQRNGPVETSPVSLWSTNVTDSVRHVSIIFFFLLLNSFSPFYFGTVTQRNLFHVYNVPYWVLSWRKQLRRRINGYFVINICPRPRCGKGWVASPSHYPISPLFNDDVTIYYSTICIFFFNSDTVQSPKYIYT